jgi:hypothetical protein
MSKQLNRIRHLMHDIEQIQKHGQEQARVQGTGLPPAPPAAAMTQAQPTPVLVTPPPVIAEVKAPEPVPAPVVAPITFAQDTILEMPPSVEQLIAASFKERVQVAAVPAATPAKIFLKLTGDVAVQLQIEETDELVEVRHVHQNGTQFIEIRFADGKAFHLPLKNVA